MFSFLKSDNLKIKLLLILVVLFLLFDYVFYPLFNKSFDKNHFFVYTAFQNTIGYSTAFVLRLWYHSSKYLADENVIQVDNQLFAIQRHWGILKFFYLSIIVFIYPLPPKKTITLFIVSSFIIFSLLIARLVLKQLTHFDLVSIDFDSIFKLLFIYILLYKVKKHYGFKRIFVNIQNRLSTMYIKSIKTILILLATYSLIAESILYFFGNTLIKIQLLFTQLLMSLLGYTTTIHFRSLVLESSRVTMWPPCLGLKLMLLFSILILVVKGSLKSKAIFIVFGIGIIFLINTIRLIYLLLHLHKYHNIDLTMINHNYFDFAIYGITLLLWYFYNSWFKSFFDNRKVDNIVHAS